MPVKGVTINSSVSALVSAAKPPGRIDIVRLAGELTAGWWPLCRTQKRRTWPLVIG